MNYFYCDSFDYFQKFFFGACMGFQRYVNTFQNNNRNNIIQKTGVYTSLKKTEENIVYQME
jgi:hypothetical protein